MTSSEREQLVWFLVEAEVEESRLTKIVDPNAVLGQEPVVVNPLQMAGRLAKRGGSSLRSAAGRAASSAGDFFLGQDKGHSIVTPTSITKVRGIPGYKGTQAYGHAVTLGRGAAGAGRAAGGFISAGARGQGIAQDVRSLRALGGLSTLKTWGPGHARSNARLRSLAGNLGRTGAVYGGAAALTAGGALGARALYRRHKARKARRQEQE